MRKLQIGRLVVGWVTTSEYLLLHVFCFSLNFFLQILSFNDSPGLISLAVNFVLVV
jgi:hypothetical protein